MRAIIYARVSSDQAGGRSVSEQESDCRAICEREGWEVAEVVSDNDIGASRWSRGERSGFARVQEILREGDVLVTWEASRAQRDLEVYVQLRKLCAGRGVFWSYSGRTYDLRKGDDRFSTGLDALLAERASEETRDRVLRALRHNAAEGRPHSTPPYGYRVKRDDLTGRSLGWELVEPDAGVVREIVRRMLVGDAAYAIAKDLNARGVPTRRGNPWLGRSVSKLAALPSIAGLRTHHGRVVGEGNWPALISVDDHRRIVAMLRDPRRLTHHGIAPRHLLSGIALCGVCGNSVIQKTARKGVYSCRAEHGAHVTRLQFETDEVVIAEMLGWVTAPDFVAELTAAGSDDDATTALDEAAVLQGRLDEAVELAARGGLSMTALGRLEAQLQPEIDRLHSIVPRAGEDLVWLDLALTKDPRGYWDGLPIDRRRQMVRNTFAVTILPVERRGRHIFDPDSIGIDWA